MTFELEIEGVPRLLIAGSYHKTETANRRCVASFRIDSADRSYRPAEGDEVTITVDGNLDFAGLIDKPREKAQAGQKRPGISTIVNVIDFTVYAERRVFKGTLVAGTLKSQLTTLAAPLSGYGVTLDAGQVDGPSMPDLTYDDVRIDVIFNEMMTLTADAGQPFVWEIDYDKTLRAYQPSTEPAPFDLVGDNLTTVVSDIEVETSRSDQYANRIILKIAPQTEIEHTETFTEGVDAYPYVPQFTVLRHYGYIGFSGTGNNETLGPPGDPDNPFWVFDPSVGETGTLTRAAGAPTGGAVTTFKFDGSFSGRWVADAGADPEDLVERVVTLKSIPNNVTGQAFADAELAKRMAPIITVKYSTLESGLTIAQQQTITIPARNVNDDAVISQVDTYTFGPRALKRHVVAVIDATQTNLGRQFQDDYEIWYGDKPGGGAIATTVGGGGPTVSAGPGQPDTSVQFNKGGTFGGDESFKYNYVSNSVVCGLLSSITAANYESCGVFGYDGHIADP